ncbi:MAG: two-component system CheB/CheR fusion protein [Paraglaciecola sp.]|jgi:two-component system CheB/CheR fusion protein
MNDDLPIIGIGASAGGLEALELFFKNVPKECGMAFVVVMHLDPSHNSLLPELLQRQTKMDVVKIGDHQYVEKNKIYVIPPGKNLLIANRRLELTESVDLHVRSPIDFFFKSLAQDHGSSGACVILSGTGSDGKVGLQEIKDHSGYVIVQSIASAKYDGMPKNAIATGLVDCILVPEKMPQQLIKHFNKKNQHQQPADMKILSNSFTNILTIIKNKTGHDFSLYKKKTISRRIERRMQVLHLANINDYLELVGKDTNEVITLFQDLLIGVTCFFRDKEAFALLSSSVLPQLLDNKPDNYTIRVWVPGCSTGEEAYSVAILLQEYLKTTGKNMNIKIFATDIDEHSIDKARSGRYSLSGKIDITEKYFHSYFITSGDYFQVKQSIRETVVFATQNITKDPPFSKLDIICCRNLLIYFSHELQKNIFPIFHYSLKERGVLFLGPSETTGQSNNYFEIINRKWKIFKRKSLEKDSTSELYFTDKQSSIKMEKNTKPVPFSPITELSALQLVETILKKSHIQSCVIVNNQMDIIYVHGRLGHYLEPAQGRLTNNILEMARTPQLREDLSYAIRSVLLHKKEITKKSIPLEIDNKKKCIDLTVKLLNDAGNLKDLVMVTFSEKTSVKPEELEVIPNSGVKNDEVNILVKELESTRDNLETTVEELETANEELKSANEELQSTNEELQSTNEELETSKEELQSLNEESVTVNAQLQSHIDELSSANDDIKNLLDSTQVATLFLDTELKIRRFTPKITDIIHLLPTDIHRPVSHLSSCLQDIKLSEIAAIVLKKLEKIEQDVHDDKQNYYKMRVLPYRTANNIIAGVVISFTDITSQRNSEMALIDSEKRYKSLFDNCPFTILEIDTSKLANYITINKITTVDKLRAHFDDQNFDAHIMTNLICALNINKTGLVLFSEKNKATLLEKLPANIESETYLFNQMKMIIENKYAAAFKSKITNFKNNSVNCEITITIPDVNKTSNFLYTILVITPEKS